MLAETTKDVLREHGYMSAKDSPDSLALAKAIGELLLQKPVAVLEELDEKALTIEEIRLALFGQQDDVVSYDLSTVISPLTGPRGLVQKEALENGYVLCSARIIRRATIGDTTVTIKRPGRFVTMNPDLVESYAWAAAMKRLVSWRTGFDDLLGISIKRVPALEARRATMIGKVHEQIALLPATTPPSQEA